VFCFDTDVLAAALLREPPLPLVRRLSRTPAEEQSTTAVTVAEIAYAAERNGDGNLIERLGELIATGCTVAPFDDAAAVVYGRLRAQLEGVGVRLDEPSLRIASIAVARGLTLVTANARLYDRVPGLVLEDWLAPDGLELEDVPEEAADPAEGAPAPSDGRVRHPGLVPSLEARARAATERSAGSKPGA
jgi:tRNA(fMet)-specific endonuclease VapC